MRALLIVLTLLAGTTGFCQNTDIPVLQNEKPVGLNLLDGSALYSTEYIFPENIYETFYDHSTGYLTLKLRGLNRKLDWYNTGIILQYDIGSNTTLWNKSTSYRWDNFYFYDSAIIKNTGKKSYYLDVHTGVEMWETKDDIFFIDPFENVAIGYKFLGTIANSYDLQGIDLRTGNVIWKRYLYHEYGWNDFFYMNDSTLAVVAAGLNTVNIHTGKGWHVNKTTTKKDYSGTITANAIGLATGLLTGAFIVFTGHDLINDLVSNALEDSSHMYLATYEELTKMDKQTGDIAWNFQFTNEHTSKSSIFIRDNILYMVNLGMGYVAANSVDVGHPFFAAFNKDTGQSLFNSMVYSKKEPILDYEIHGDEIYFLFKHKIMKYSIETGNAISEKFFPANIGSFEYFIGDEVFVETAEEYFMPLRETDTRYLYIRTGDNTIAIDNQFNIMLHISNKHLNLNYLSTEDFKFILKVNNTLIIDNEGEPVAEVEASKNAFLIDHTLFETRDNRLIAINLQEILISE